MRKTRVTAHVATLGSLLWLAGCGGGDADTTASAATASAVAGYAKAVEESRPHDSRSFLPPDPALASDYEMDSGGMPSFRPLAGTSVATDRWAGVLDGAGYRIEVPHNWNGKLVMYAHGYAGTGEQLRITTPSLRRHLIENGYAWAASSFSKNYYDVRAGVEDTNALALQFKEIARQRGRELRAPAKTYIIGHSMGGHIAGAAIEEETYKTAVNKVKYDGAVPLCGVMGDTELFDYFGAYQMAAQALAGHAGHPSTDFGSIAGEVRATLFQTFTSVPTGQGEKLREIVKNLTGGARPGFTQGFDNANLQNTVWGTFGRDGTTNGILASSSVDTHRFAYQLDDDPALSPEETAFNAEVQRLSAVPDANRLRSDGLRWIPQVNGQFKIPVVTLHTLGDMYVPFSMQQIYRKRVEAQGNGEWLVQRAVRAPGHCDFTVREQAEAFDAMTNWAENKIKPHGDEVRDPAVVAHPDYGCTYTRTPVSGVDSGTLANARASIPACS